MFRDERHRALVSQATPAEPGWHRNMPLQNLRKNMFVKNFVAMATGFDLGWH
jgi:hypothetical protein